MQWFGNGTDLPDKTTLITLHFNYLTAGATTSLVWYDNVSSCEYTDNSNDRLIDLPYANFYFNGSVGSGIGLPVYAKTYLQGGYVASTHLMRTSLAEKSLVPLAHPYGGAPWNYAGTEQLSSVPAGTVDWVLAELRSGTSASTVVERRAALLLNDGTLADINGSAPLLFASAPAGSYYLVIYHRNHLPVMSAGLIALPNTPATTHNFTINPASNVYSVSFDGVIAVETGIYAQIAGELTYDNKLIFSGSGNDRGKIIAKINELFTPPPAYLTSVIAGYHPEDLNLDGAVIYSGPNNDQGMIFSNIDALTPSTILNTVLSGQVPVNYSGN